MFWFFLIVRILYRIVFKGITKDERSEDEDEGEEVEVEKEKELRAVNGKAVSPKNVGNGRVGGGGGDATAVEVEDRKATLRKR